MDKFARFKRNWGYFWKLDFFSPGVNNYEVSPLLIISKKRLNNIGL